MCRPPSCDGSSDCMLTTTTPSSYNTTAAATSSPTAPHHHNHHHHCHHSASQRLVVAQHRDGGQPIADESEGEEERKEEHDSEVSNAKIEAAKSPTPPTSHTCNKANDETETNANNQQEPFVGDGQQHATKSVVAPNHHLTDAHRQLVQSNRADASQGLGDDVDENDDDEDADDDDDDDADDDEDDGDDEDDEDEEDEDDDDEDDEDDDEAESEDDSEDIVDPGQHCQLIHNNNHHHLHHHHYQTAEELNDENLNINITKFDDGSINDILDGERMLEVTRKLVRNTERDPDRDLRKQVLLKTAIKKLPHFMDYNRYPDSLDQSFHNNISTHQAYHEHHDSQQKFYHSVQPNAIQMSTTSLRMLDLNDDQDPELNNIEHDQPQQQHPDPNNMGYHNNNINDANINNINFRTTSLEQHDYVSSHLHQYDRYHQRANDPNHHHNSYNETSNPMISRHNSLDNLYQPTNGSDISEDLKDERIPVAFQISCEIYDFTCAPDDNERKLLDNLTNGYYTRPTREPRTNVVDDGGGEDGTETRDQDGSDTSSSSHSSSSDDCANSIVLQSTESDEANDTSLLEASLNSSSDFYHSSHDSGVALFSPRSNKRSSSSIGLDDDMEIDQLTELSTRSASIGSNNQYKKLRKREIMD